VKAGAYRAQIPAANSSSHVRAGLAGGLPELLVRVRSGSYYHLNQRFVHDGFRYHGLFASGREGRVTPPLHRRLISPYGKTKLPLILKE